MTELPEALQEALQPLFQALPIDAAMGELVVTQPPEPSLVHLVQQVLTQPSVQEHPALEAGIWLYIDELARAHVVSQQLDNPTGAWWHAIVHRREGDFQNSQYWYRKVGQHPARRVLTGYDGVDFANAVSEHHGENPAELIALQRAEWQTLFTWCATQPE